MIVLITRSQMEVIFSMSNCSSSTAKRVNVCQQSARSGGTSITDVLNFVSFNAPRGFFENTNKILLSSKLIANN